MKRWRQFWILLRCGLFGHLPLVRVGGGHIGVKLILPGFQPTRAELCARCKGAWVTRG